MPWRARSWIGGTTYADRVLGLDRTGFVTSDTLPSGIVTTNQADGMGRLTTRTDALGNRAETVRSQSSSPGRRKLARGLLVLLACGAVKSRTVSMPEPDPHP